MKFLRNDGAMLKNILSWAIFTVKDTAGLAVLINKCQNVFA